jgi:zinc and cadmium transporter
MESAVIIKTLIVLVSAILGAAFIFFLSLDHKKLCRLISFSAGALLGAAVFTLLPETFASLSFSEILLGGFSGYFLFWFISHYFAHVCPACSASHFDEQTTKKFSEIVLTLLVALSIHSFLDGVAIATGSGNQMIRNNSVFIAITIHKFPEGLALTALMLSSDYRKGKILAYVFLVEFVTVLGAVSGIYIFESGISPVIMGIIMAHIAGGFVYLAFHAVMGEMLKNHRSLVISFFGFGMILIFTVRILFGSF